MATHRDNDVGKSFGGLDEEFVHRFHEGAVMADGLIESPTPLYHIPADDADESLVGIRIHEDLDIHRIAQFRVGEDEDALHDEHLSGMHGNSLLAACAGHVGIGRHRNSLALFQLVDVVHQQRELNGGRVIEVDLLLFCLGEVSVIAIIGVLRQHTDMIFGKLVDDFLHHRGLSRAGTSGNT